MKFTIITVCYNSASTIDQTISSVLSQSYSEFEYIIIDGGSADDTTKIIKKFRDKRIRLISEADDGIYDALNKGMHQANGDFILILHSDDYWDNEKYLDILKENLLRSSAKVAYGNAKFISKTKRTVLRKWISSSYKSYYLILGWMPPHTSLVLSKDVVSKIGNYRLDLGSASDYDYVLRVFKEFGEVSTYINKIYVIMRVGGVSTKISSLLINNILQDYKILRIHYSLFFAIVALVCKRLNKITQILG
jgi:glycosyltransferase involved in cell wall biosynthesis